jgi:aspartyl-tRNA(Asn)/glutamyl-tRNA(Gln) amidotransferase subunit A
MYLSVREVAQSIRDRKISPVELTLQCLARIEKLNPALNAFVTVTADMALTEARQAEAEIQRGNWRGPLHGVPVALKDLIDTAGVRTTAGSALFKDRVPKTDAEVVRRLKEAGAVLLGKQNLHEFAYGGSSLISFFGEVRNPWNPGFIAGGSSGGSAAAVSAGLCFASIGTDTAGSIREPAALCGVVGLKPTYGRVSTQGVIPLSPSLDHVGPITRTVSDTALVLQAIADPAAREIAGRAPGLPDYLEGLASDAGNLRIGIPRDFFFADLDPEVSDAVEAAVLIIRAIAAEMREVRLSVNTDRTLQAGESFAIHREWAEQSPDLYQPETLRRVRTGAAITEAEIKTRRQELLRLRNEIQATFQQVDVLVTATTPIPARCIADLKQNPESLRPMEILLLRNTRPANVWGLPAISVPCGCTRAGLPIGLQIIGPHWGEENVLRLAHAFEQATDWHKRQPDIG